MDTSVFEKKVKEARNVKRNFSQSFELIINFKDLDLKKPDNQVDVFVRLPQVSPKQKKVCALVDADMVDEAEKHCDGVVQLSDFSHYAQDKKLAKKMAKKYDFFIAQANVMPKVATTFGRVLGPRGQMPNPSAGAIFPAKAQLAPVVEKFRNTIRARVLKMPLLQCFVGTDAMDDKAIAENAAYLLEQVVNELPGDVANLRSVFIKTTMGKPVQVR